MVGLGVTEVVGPPPQFFPDPGMEMLSTRLMPVNSEMMLMIMKEDKARIMPTTAIVMVFLALSVP